MIRTTLVLAGVIALAACGGGGKSDLVEACVDEGETRKGCTCMADKLEEGLSPEAFEAMVLGATGKDEEAEAVLKELGMGEAMKTAGVMMRVAVECGVSGFGG